MFRIRFALLFFLPVFGAATPAKLAPEFTKDAKTVSYRGVRIKGAEPQTFQQPCAPEYQDRKGEAVFCAVDAKHIFLGVRGEVAEELKAVATPASAKSARPAAPPRPADLKKQAAKSGGVRDVVRVVALDRAPIRALGNSHFQMDRTVYFKSLTQPMPQADFAVFEELAEENDSGIDSRHEWSRDDRFVYCQGKPIEGLTPPEVSFWPFLSWDCNDLVSNQIGSLPATGYIRDFNAVYLFIDCRLDRKLQDADPLTFEVPNMLFPSRARDNKGHAYTCGNLTTRRKSSED